MGGLGLGLGLWGAATLRRFGEGLTQRIVSPDNFTVGAAWGVAGGISSVGVHTITEDSSNGLHAIYQPAAVSGLVTTRPYYVRADVPLASGNGRYVTLIFGDGTEKVFLDAQTGTIIGTAGGVSNAVYSNGVLTCTVLSAAGPTVYVSTGNGTQSFTFQGNGLRTATVGPGTNGYPSIAAYQ